MLKLKEFLIDDLFEKVPTKSLNLKVSDCSTIKTEQNNLPALTAGIQNQGLSCFVSRKNKTVLKNLISVSANGANSGAMFYQPKEFTVLQDSYVIKYKYKEPNEKEYLYLLTALQKTIRHNFDWTNKAGWNKIKNYSISLPVTKDNEIDFKYMENYISELEEERISELTAYLKVSGLEDYKLTDEEQKSVEKFNNKEVKTKSFKLGEGNDRLFDITTTKKKFNANCIKFGGKYPYVARSSINNGIRGYITEDEQYLNEAKTISFGQDTATMFYQEKPYFTGDKIKIMTYREKELDKNLACYLITLMKKAFQNFSWGQSSFNETILKNIKIEMPITSDGNIDYDFIETFINAQQKLAIKSVVDWRDIEINTTKKLIS